MSVMGKAIRSKCLDCSGNQRNEVRLCPVTTCPLYSFRFGRNPYYNKTSKKEGMKKDDTKQNQESLFQDNQ